jgi:ABC-type transport system substrate-binding protein
MNAQRLVRLCTATFVLVLVVVCSPPALGKATGQALQPNAQLGATEADDDATPHPLLSQPEVRRALAHCTDRVALAQRLYPFLSTAQAEALVMSSFLPIAHTYYAEPPGLPNFEYDPVAAGQLLDSIGWLLTGDGIFRRNDDDYELTIGATFPQSPLHQILGGQLAEQWRACGIRLVNHFVPTSVLLQGNQAGSLAQRSFEVAGFTWVAQPIPNVRRLYGCNSVPTADNGWFGFNIMGWCNPEVEQAIEEISLLAAPGEIQNAFATIQSEFAEDVPSVPLFQYPGFYAAHDSLQNYDPQSLGRDTWNAADWSLPGQNTLVIRASQEPRDLFLDPSSAHQRVNGLIHDPLVVFDDFTPQPNLLAALPSQDNGLVQTRLVQVLEGDIVFNADSVPVTLEPGVELFLPDDTLVIYDGGSVTLLQADVLFQVDEMVLWGDGVPVSADDYRLAYAVFCANEPPDDSECDAIEDVEFADNGYEITYIPGARELRQFLSPFTFFPAHQVIETPGEHQGKQLGDVPIEEWGRLFEVTDTPLTTGPYQVFEWIRGERMVLRPNPHYREGPVEFEEIVLRFDLNGLEAAEGLADGSVDVADVIDAANPVSVTNPTSVTVHVTPSEFWEHLDFNFDLYSQTVARVLSETGGLVTTTLGISVTIPDLALPNGGTVLVDTLPRVPYSITFPSVTVKAFEITLYDTLFLTVPVTVTEQATEIHVTYTDQELGTVDETLLNVYHWNGTRWVPLLPCDGCGVKPDENEVVFYSFTTGQFSLLGRNTVFAPLFGR